jgi:SAM-dependent methyltransferase
VDDGSRHTSAAIEEHAETLRRFYDEVRQPSQGWALGYRKLLAHYYSQMIQAGASVLEIGCGDGTLLEMLPGKEKAGIDLSATQIEMARKRLPSATFEVVAGEMFEPTKKFDIIIVSDTLNQASDCQLLLDRARGAAHPGTRILINVFNSLWTPILSAARRAGALTPAPEHNWLSRDDVVNFLDLSDWDYIRDFGKILIPVADSIVAGGLNRWLAPWFSWFALTLFVVARPRFGPVGNPPGISIVVPARNEALNLENAVRRVPRMAANQEWIFVEGGSRDNTWEVMQTLPSLFPDCRIKCIRQTGKGKANAVWEGFAIAEGEVLMILDADLTVPPEELPKFYQAILSGKAELANGVRLVYPMDEKAMQFWNLCANKLFAVLFTALLEQPVKDTLCGTKVLTKSNYEHIRANRSHFGDFDPFGDFDLLFGAARLNLKITDIPIRYRERTYGETNISRWRHGVILLRMMAIAAVKLKFL